MIDQAHGEGARLHPACAEVGLSLRTYQRWRIEGRNPRRRSPQAVRPAPANKLSPEQTPSALTAVVAAPTVATQRGCEGESFVGDNTLVLLLAVAYLAVMLVIGVWANTRMKSAREFLVAGQSLGFFVSR